MRSDRWTHLVIALALLRAMIGLVGLALLPPPSAAYALFFPDWAMSLLVTSFTVGAVLLVIGGRRDRRALWLGTVMAILAATFAAGSVDRLADAATGLAGQSLRLIHPLSPRSLLLFYLGLFVRDFPAPVRGRRLRRMVDALLALLGAAGVAVMIAHLATVSMRSPPRLPALLKELHDYGFQYVLLLVLPLCLLPKIRRAAVETRRRLSVFLASMLLSLGPIAIQVFLEALLPSYRAFAHRPDVRPIYNGVIFPLLAALPLTTTYSVLVHKILDLRLIARSALRYALARATTVGATLIPFAALVTYAYAHRRESLEYLFSGPRVLVLILLTGLGLSAQRYRRRLLEALDRRFFRERYDARQLLEVLVDQIRSAPDEAALAELLTGGLDQVLHLERAAMLVEEPAGRQLRDPLDPLRTLEPESKLAGLLASRAGPLNVDLSNPRHPLQALPPADRRWLSEGPFQLLFPLISTDGSLLGALALGGKKSGLPFLKEDRQMLAALVGSASLVLELRRRSEGEGADPPAGRPAGECVECGDLFLPRATHCFLSHPLTPASVPYVLPGKLRFERRLGEGAMGVVYEAVDLALGRRVAVKTLKRLSPDDAVRLRREARTAAAVSHTHLGSVFTVESWRGTPMLVMEFMEGGTLADRLAGGPLSPKEVVELGIAMARALELLHQTGILHRDIKPNNISFTGDGVPKLMDFGIASNALDPASPATSSSSDSGTPRVEALPPTILWGPRDERSSRRLVGTLAYLPPEALRGEEPDASFDLWSLNLVLLECLTGRRVFTGGDPEALMRRIRRQGVPPIEEECPGCPAPFADLLGRNLARSPIPRTATAAELAEELEGLRGRLGGGPEGGLGG